MISPVFIRNLSDPKESKHKEPRARPSGLSRTTGLNLKRLPQSTQRRH